MNAYVLSILTAVMWGVGALMENRVLSKLDRLTYYCIVGSLFAITSIIILAFNKKDVMKQLQDIRGDPKFILFVVSTAFLASVLSFLVYFKAISIATKKNIHIIAALAFSAPLFTLFASIIIYKRLPNAISILGACLIVIGSVLIVASQE